MIRLVLPYPISANRYWVPVNIPNKLPPIAGRQRPSHRQIFVPSQEAKVYKEECSWIAKSAGLAEPLAWRFAMELRLYPALPQDWQKRKRASVYWDDDVRCMDLGNCEKVLSDALQGIVYTDDRWIWQQHKLRMEPDHKGPRVEVLITPFDRARETAPTHQEALQL